MSLNQLNTLNTLNTIKDNFDENMILESYVRKLNYLLITLSNTDIDLAIKSAGNTQYVIDETFIVDNTYNENIMKEINETIEINKNNLVINNDKYNINFKENIYHGESVQSYIRNGLWNNLKHTGITNIIKNNQINIRIFENNNTQNFDVNRIDDILNKISERILISLEPKIGRVDFKIDDTLVEAQPIQNKVDENTYPIDINLTIRNYKMDPAAFPEFYSTDSSKLELKIFIDSLKEKINNKFKKNNYTHHDQPEIEKFILNIPYPQKLLDLLDDKKKYNLLNKLLIHESELKTSKTSFNYNFINTIFYHYDTDSLTNNKSYNYQILNQGNQQSIEKKYKKDKFIKEALYIKYLPLEWIDNKDIREGLTSDMKKSIKKFDDKQYYEYDDIKLFNSIKEFIYNDNTFIETIKDKYDGTKIEEYKKYLENIKVEPSKYVQYGGYNSINHRLNMIDYELIRPGPTKSFITYQKIDSIDYTYIDENNTEINYKSPLKRQIYYKIRNIKTNEEKKIVLINLYYERSDVNNREKNKDYFFQYDIKYKDLLNEIIFTRIVSGHKIKNIISLYDTLNYLFVSSRQKNNRYRKKYIMMLFLFINLLYKNNSLLLSNEIISHIRIANISNNNYITDIKNKCDEIIKYIKTSLENKSDAETYHLFDALNFSVILKPKTSNIDKIYIGGEFILLEKFECINNNDVDLYKDTIEQYLNNSIISTIENLYSGEKKFNLILLYNEIENHNCNVLNINQDYFINKTEYKNLQKGILRDHTEYIDDTKEKNLKFNSLRAYTAGDSKKINEILYKFYITPYQRIQNMIDNNLLSFSGENDIKKKVNERNYIENTKLLLNVYNTILTVDNSSYKPDYLILTSFQDEIFGKSQIPSISNFDIGDEFFVPYFVSTSVVGHGLESFSKPLAYKFIVIVPTNEQYICLLGKINNNTHVSAYPDENEILLPPGYYKLLNVTKMSPEFYQCIVLYESLKINEVKNMKLILNEENNLLNNSKLLKIIREKMIIRNTLLDKKILTDSQNNLEEIDFDKEIQPFIKNPKFIGLSKLLPFNKNMFYELTNISPLRNIFTFETLDSYKNEGKHEFKCFKINYKTMLYSGQSVSSEVFDKPLYGSLYLSNLLVSTAYGIAKDTSVLNNYTFLLDGTEGKDIILIDNFHPDNIKVIKEFYDTLGENDERKNALNIYYKFSDTYNESIILNNKPIRIKYNNMYYSNLPGDYLKYSQSTETDKIVSNVYTELFGKHDGYISKAQFASKHYSAVFDDELALYNFYELREQKRIKLLLECPTTIIIENIKEYINNPRTEEEKLHLLIINTIYSIRKIIAKTKINRLYESFKYSFMFDKYVPYTLHPYEKYFRNIYEILLSHGKIYLNDTKINQQNQQTQQNNQLILVKTYHDPENTKPYEVYSMIDNKKEGVYKRFYPTGQLWSECYYKNNERDGKFVVYYDNGNILRICNYDNGKLEGEDKSYNKDGQINSLCFYKNDIEYRKCILYPDNLPIKYTYYDNEKTKIMEKYYELNNQKEGEYKSYHANGQLLEICNYKNNKKEGEFIYYYENGQIELICNYKDGEIDGEYKEYYINGNLKELCTYKNYRKDGEYKLYHQNGQLQKKYNYKNDKINGIYEQYNNTGKLILISSYIDDKKHGKSIRYNKDGKIIDMSNYINDQLEGIYKRYTENGQVKEICNYKDNHIVGNCENFASVLPTRNYYDSKNNIVMEEYYQIKGKKDGAYKLFHPNGKLEVECHYENDLIQGVYKSYHSNEQLESICNYIDDKIEGEYKSYYENGKIKEICYYINGNLKGECKKYNNDSYKQKYLKYKKKYLKLKNNNY